MIASRTTMKLLVVASVFFNIQVVYMRIELENFYPLINDQ
jgi:hypothetical protein